MIPTRVKIPNFKSESLKTLCRHLYPFLPGRIKVLMLNFYCVSSVLRKDITAGDIDIYAVSNKRDIRLQLAPPRVYGAYVAPNV